MSASASRVTYEVMCRQLCTDTLGVSPTSSFWSWTQVQLRVGSQWFPKTEFWVQWLPNTGTQWFPLIPVFGSKN